MSQKIDSLATACQLLRELSQAGRACSLAELAKLMDLPKSTAKRMLETLEGERFLERDGDKYKIGYELAKIRTVYRNQQIEILNRVKWTGSKTEQIIERFF